MHFGSIDHFPNLLHSILHHHANFHARRPGSRPVLRFVLGRQHCVVLDFDSLTKAPVAVSCCLAVDRLIGLVPLLHRLTQRIVVAVPFAVAAAVVETRLLEYGLQDVLSAPLGVPAVVARERPLNEIAQSFVP